MRTVLEIDTLFDGRDTVGDAALVIDDGVVTWAGKRSRTPKTPKGERSRTVEAPARSALPGMVNCHAHLTFDGTSDFEAEARQSAAMATLKAVANGRASLRAGVTTVRDLGANGTMVIDLAEAIERGILDGPRIIPAGRGITTTGGHGTEIGLVCDGVEEVRRGVRQQIAAGAGVIKLFSTGGVLGRGAGPERSQYTPDETRTAIEEAHRAGIRITTHAHGAEGMRMAAEAGVDSIEHATLLDARTIGAIKDHGVALVPTFSALHAIVENAASLPAYITERARVVASKHREGVRAAHKAGVRVVAGTDAGTPFNRHERYALELHQLVEMGMTREQALVAATSGAADVVGRPKAGRLIAGSWADIVFVASDPTRDLDVLLAPKAVWIRGVTV